VEALLLGTEAWAYPEMNQSPLQGSGSGDL